MEGGERFRVQRASLGTPSDSAAAGGPVLRQRRRLARTRRGFWIPDKSGALMNVAGLVGALLPVFFVLALGYVAGKQNAFDTDQAAGLSKLALGFALPASLFVSMTDIKKDLLLQQGTLVLALIPSSAHCCFPHRRLRYSGSPCLSRCSARQAPAQWDW